MIKVGIIGTGFIAKEHAIAIASSGKAKLVAAADIVPERLEEFRTGWNIPRAYSSASDLIADADVDLVTIATPPASHVEFAISALDHGKYVLCEKPLAHSIDSAVQIVAAEARHPGRIAVSHQLRYEPSYRRLLWLCRNNWIGEPQSALIERHSYIPQSDPGKVGWGSWKATGGGVLITQLIHQLDILLLVMGQPVTVSAQIDTRYTEIESEDFVDATIRFASGALARCIGSVNSGRSDGQFSITGARGTVKASPDIVMDDPQRLAQALKEVDRALPDTRLASTSLLSRGLRFLSRRLGIAGKPELSPHGLLYGAIASNIEKRAPLPIPPKEALESLELCMAAYESAITGKEVALPLNSSTTVYGGVSKASYDERQCVRRVAPMAQPSGVKIVNGSTIRIGLIGLDTTHATTFTKILHDPSDPFHIPGAKVVAAYPGGSPDMDISISRVGGFISELRDRYGVRIMDAPEDVAEACDLVFILACDGRRHPALFRSVAGRGKPVFIDKPFAISRDAAGEIFALAKETKTLVFASSAYRYADELVNALESIRVSGEKVKSCCVRLWLPIQETQGRYFWYGIHGAEMLLAIMGRGVRAVSVSAEPDKDTFSVWHDDGRESSIVGSQNDGAFRVHIATDKRMIDIGIDSTSVSSRVLRAALDVLTEGRFPRLWRATAVGSVSGNPSFPAVHPAPEETLEVIGLLDASQRSYATKQIVAV
jgi:predicted dehydrogenase